MTEAFFNFSTFEEFSWIPKIYYADKQGTQFIMAWIIFVMNPFGFINAIIPMKIDIIEGI